MLLKDLRKAIKDGELVDITGVKLRSWGTDNQLPAVLHINFDVPSVENKPINDRLDITEISLSTKPKYDPCRPFKRGDKAKPRIINGREIPKMPLGVIFTVTGDEDEYGIVPVEYISPARGLLTSTTVHAVWLELVTPMEELAPYSVHESEVANCFDIVREKMCVMTFPYGPKEAGYYRNKLAAKEAAEAERDRLNNECRKEQK